MQTKTSTLLTISVAAILTLSVVAMQEMPQALANKSDDEDHDKNFKGFSKKPDFESKNCIVTSYATDNLSLEALESLDCSTQAWFNGKTNSLEYKVTISGMELIDSDDNTQDDLYQLHIHKNTIGTPENPEGPHQLNVYRGPGFDDADLFVLPVQGVLKGSWDDEDENLSYGEPDNSHTLTENIHLLCEGKIFSAGHGDAEDMPGHHAPYIKMLLEPTKNGEKVCKKLGF